jgi:UDP-N-acetylmuramyl pentapeptide phosphotransferase/UDP-N-acetylglucosamine-1-phosphate transferase
MVSSWIFLAVAVGVVTWCAIWAIRPSLIRLATAHPNERSSHAIPTPQGAGLAILPVALVAAATGLLISRAAPIEATLHLLTVSVAALALLVVGLFDDIGGLPITPRVTIQVLAVLGVVVTLPSGIRVLPDGVPLVVERGFIALAGLWYLNLYNFMDGIDLMTATETAAITIGVAIFAAVGLAPEWLGWPAAALAGATLGFVPWNAPPARIFIGNSGSVAIALITGVLLLHVAGARGLAVALIIPLYFTLDATITLIRRLLRGERFWEGHRQHFYQQALRNDFTVWRIVGTVAMLNAVLIALALAAAMSLNATASVIASLAATAAVLAVLRRFALPRI